MHLSFFLFANYFPRINYLLWDYYVKRNKLSVALDLSMSVAGHQPWKILLASSARPVQRCLVRVDSLPNSHSAHDNVCLYNHVHEESV